MRKYVIGSIEAIATVIAILTIAGIINSVIGLVGKSQIFGTISLSAIGLIWSLFNYKKDKNYKYIAYAIGAIITIILALGLLIASVIQHNNEPSITPTSNISFSETFSVVCYAHYKGNEKAQKLCMSDMQNYEQALDSGKYKKNCADIEEANWEYQSYLTESRSYGMNRLIQEGFLALSAIRDIAPKFNCQVSSWIGEFQSAIEAELRNAQ